MLASYSALPAFTLSSFAAFCLSTTERTATIDIQATTGGRYASIGTLTADELEAGFVNAFLVQGARLIDRDAIIRKLSLQIDRTERIDLQLLETQTPENGVAYLIEVLPARDPAPPMGWAFTMRLKHLPTASLVGQVRTLAVPPAVRRLSRHRPGLCQKEHRSHHAAADRAPTGDRSDVQLHAFADACGERASTPLRARAVRTSFYAAGA